ncbi:MAG: serine hydroxymethyltransferase [Oceanicaulis sp.]
MSEPLEGREVIFEFVAIGDSVRVAAVDVATGEEVVVTGPRSAAQLDLERIAGRKLARKLGLVSKDGSETKTPRRGGRGVIV